MARKARSSSSSSSESSSSSSSSEPVPTRTPITIEKLTPNVTSLHLNQIFSKFGNIGNISIIPDKIFNSAILEYEKKQQAETAVSYMNKGWIDGSRISVSLQSLKEEPAAKKSSNQNRRKHIDKDRNRRRSPNHRRQRNKKRRSSSSSGFSGSYSSESSNSSS